MSIVGKFTVTDHCTRFLTLMAVCRPLAYLLVSATLSFRYTAALEPR